MYFSLYFHNSFSLQFRWGLWVKRVRDTAATRLSRVPPTKSLRPCFQRHFKCFSWLGVRCLDAPGRSSRPIITNERQKSGWEKKKKDLFSLIVGDAPSRDASAIAGTKMKTLRNRVLLVVTPHLDPLRSSGCYGDHRGQKCCSLVLAVRAPASTSSGRRTFWAIYICPKKSVLFVSIVCCQEVHFILFPLNYPFVTIIFFLLNFTNKQKGLVRWWWCGDCGGFQSPVMM